jgi:hypothetical protein
LEDFLAGLEFLEGAESSAFAVEGFEILGLFLEGLVGEFDYLPEAFGL